MNKLIAVVGLLFVGILVESSESPATAQSPSISIVSEFGTHAGDGLFEPEVFVEKKEGSGELFKVGPADVHQFNDAPLFATVEEIEYAPQRPGGPYVKGKPIGVTLGQWLAATGSATYTCQDGKSTVKASFENLVPNGVYTIWNFVEPDPITEPYTGLVWPLGNRDGSQSIIEVDAKGSATYEAVIDWCLELSGAQTSSGLAIALHSDGKTYGFQAGAFGYVTHTHLAALFPKESAVKAGQ